jgi:serine phosphatase RsbU (regulator of sigma subunit)
VRTMSEQFQNLWNRISRIGLRDGEGVLDFREVIFLNRILALTPIVMICYIPLEIYFNGVTMLPMVFIMIFMFMLPLPLHHFRLFRLASYYIFIVGNLLITQAGLLVGKGVHNHVALIPIVLVAIIIFKTKAERILALFITAGFFAFQQYGFGFIKPEIFIAPEIKESFAFIFFLLALILTFLIGFYFIGINREYEKIVFEQKSAIDIKNKEITDSISYAKRIQNAILPPERLVKEYLPDSFILYKPKDIVAGDFFWVEKANEKILFAAADCTGHGVPGAMISVICNNALNRSLREFGLTVPAQILNKTREIIISEFEKSEEEVKDGMDISLCSLNLSANELHWSGAHNPLLILRNNEFIELKADKQPVGKFSAARPFTDHKIQLEKNDIIYVFTDGYSDQFGGENKKKLKYKAFKNILFEIHHMSMEKQKAMLDDSIESWRGELEQVDDICVMGVRIN